MAGDRQGTINDAQMLRLSTKVFQLPPHPKTYPHGSFLMGIAGTTGDMLAIVDYFENPEENDEPTELLGPVQGLVLTEKKEIYYFSNPGQWTRLREKSYAIGSGGPVALGALKMGATPRQAVQAAAKVDPFTGHGVTYISFE